MLINMLHCFKITVMTQLQITAHKSCTFDSDMKESDDIRVDEFFQ